MRVVYFNYHEDFGVKGGIAAMDRDQAAGLLEKIRAGIQREIVGKKEAVDHVLCALLSGGHVLIEDVPGLGKTTLASTLAQCTGCSFQRIQFTPDVTPSDITGFTMFNLATGEKEFHQGAVMSQMVVADEINRTSPKTQSALLQAMQEGRVTVDGNTYTLPQPFMVLATQNPVELTGTYPLPEAQLDRFLMRISMGYPSKSQEVDILQGHYRGEMGRPVEPVCGPEEIIGLQELTAEVKCVLSIQRYIVEIAEKTRTHKEILLGISPRGSIALMRASMAWALMAGRDYVLPDDVQAMAEPVLAHRLVLDSRIGLREQGVAQKLLADLVKQVPVPAMKS